MKKHFIYTIFLLCNFVIFIFNLQNLSAEENVENIYTQALQEIKNNDLLQAQILLNKVIKLDANHAGAKLDLAILQCKIGNKFQSEILLKLYYEPCGLSSKSGVRPKSGQPPQMFINIYTAYFLLYSAKASLKNAFLPVLTSDKYSCVSNTFCSSSISVTAIFEQWSEIRS